MIDTLDNLKIFLKVGSVVICRKPTSPELVKGKEYVVVRDKYGRLSIPMGGGLWPVDFFNSSIFELPDVNLMSDEDIL
jgi:hypothetical protein